MGALLYVLIGYIVVFSFCLVIGGTIGGYLGGFINANIASIGSIIGGIACVIHGLKWFRENMFG
jgi:hypothetical protein